ncbi:MAG: rRNA maturation RNase YbeY [Ignavibacteriaceae bacterium]|nr:rRNA maturation RNase YbeY [Ignavibacteriaceae bacterium]
MSFLEIYYYKKISLSKSLIRKSLKILKSELSLSIAHLQINILNDADIISLNQKYLNHDYNTDIITFDYRVELANPIDGEIFISFEDAQKNAEKYKVSLNNELMRLIIHGVLHLSGFDDKSSIEKRKMKKMENYFLEKLKAEFEF